MKNSNETVGNRTHGIPACSPNQLHHRVPPHIARDFDYLQYNYFCPSVALSNATQICHVTNQSSLRNKSVERITQVLRLSLNTTVEG
jgi:hypothetical protein